MKIFKSSISLIMSILLLFSLFSIPSFAADIIDSGNYSDGKDSISWTFDTEGCLTIYCDGDMPIDFYDNHHFDSINHAWYDYVNDIQNIIFDGAITSICPLAFIGCRNLKTIELPDTIETINDCAFMACKSLTSLVIPDSVKLIGGSAFDECDGLKEIIIGDGVETIEENAFSSCIDTFQFTIENEAGEITGWTDVNHFPSELKVTLGKNIKFIGDLAFSNCPIKHLVIPDSVEYISDLAFLNNSFFETITVDENNKYYYSDGNCLISKYDNKVIAMGSNSVIPNDTNVNKIGGGLLIDNYNEITTTIPNNITSIDMLFLYYCLGIKEIKIPESVSYIGEAVCYDCPFLKDIYIYNPTLELTDSMLGFRDVIITCTYEEYIDAYKKAIASTVIENGTVLYTDEWKYFHSLDDGFIDYETSNAEVTIHGYEGSTAQTYAAENGFNFEIIVDECTHSNTEVQNKKEATCTDNGFSGDVICLDCGELIELGQTTDAYGHIDKDYDGLCDNCKTNTDTYNTKVFYLFRFILRILYLVFSFIGKI